MRQQEPTIKIVRISDVKGLLSRLVDQVFRQQTRVLIEKGGIPVAAIISVDDLQYFTALEREREERFAVVDRMRETFKDVPTDEIEREAARSVAAARARRRKPMTETVARSA